MLFISQSNEEQAENDNMCNLTRGILCVNDVLNEIAATTENLNQTINEIKKHILRNASIVDKIIRYVKFQMQSIDSQIPTLKYHMHFFRMSNIDKVLS
ncbi:unnamed protein product [Rotaria sp. Silwood2]|nr:unnamed protein product [Rotaria sp. Silwood2]CAF4229265.1 unnamed protein product [Rotaria sp. Silwood2]